MGNAIYSNSNLVNTTFQITGLGGANITGVVTATTFSGSGASLTNLNGSNIASGTVAAARVGSLPAVIPILLVKLQLGHLMLQESQLLIKIQQEQQEQLLQKD